MNLGRCFCHAVTVVVLIALVIWLPLPMWAGQPDNGGPQPSGTRPVESGPSLSSMERQSDGGWSYNSEYIFGITKAVRDSSMPPGAKVVVSVFSLPVDVVLLPFAALLGLLGE